MLNFDKIPKLIPLFSTYTRFSHEKISKGGYNDDLYTIAKYFVI